MISGLSRGVFQLVVHKKNHRLKSIKDIKGKKISLGPGWWRLAITTFLEVISAYGYTEKDFQAVYTSYEQASDALVDGTCGSHRGPAAPLTPSITQLTAAKKPVRFISIEEEALIRLMAKVCLLLTKLTIPKSRYMGPMSR